MNKEVDILSIKRHLNRNAMIRIFTIHNFIENSQYPNIQSLAEHLEVNARTVERDIEQLRDFFNAPLVYDRLHKGYYYEEKFALPPFQFTEGEMVVLFLGQKLLNQVEGGIYKKEIRSLSEKLQCLFNSKPNPGNFLLEDTVSFNIRTYCFPVSFALLRRGLVFDWPLFLAECSQNICG